MNLFSEHSCRLHQPCPWMECQCGLPFYFVVQTICRMVSGAILASNISQHFTVTNQCCMHGTFWSSADLRICCCCARRLCMLQTCPTLRAPPQSMQPWRCACTRRSSAPHLQSCPEQHLHARQCLLHFHAGGAQFSVVAWLLCRLPQVSHAVMLSEVWHEPQPLCRLLLRRYFTVVHPVLCHD